MNNVVKIDPRPNISAELAVRLRDMIFDGDLPAGSRINEVHLATSLGISRTPLREALVMLVAEEALDSIPRRGYFVRELSREEFEDIYPIRALLDPEALRLSGIPRPDGFERLEELNQKIRAAKNHKVRASLDDDWHLELISNCQNQVMLGLIKLFMRRFRRYGLAFLRDRDLIKTINIEHHQILQALKSGDMDSACDWLRKNLTSDKKPILEWLDARQL
jgi:DNA-binding GntR family transcriptional regulator